MVNSTRNKIRILACCAITAALVYVGTLLIRIPTPMGHVNLGDAFILVCIYCLQLPKISHIKTDNSNKLGFSTAGLLLALAGGIGSGLSDLLNGYPHFALPTFIVKTLLGVAAVKSIEKNKKVPLFVLAEVIMVAGYFIAEIFLYDFAYSVTAFLPNCAQGLVAVIIATVVTEAVKRISDRLE